MVPLTKGVRGDLQGFQASPSRSVCFSGKCQVSSLHLGSSRSDGVEAGHRSTPLGLSLSLCLLAVCSALAGIVESVDFDRAFVGSGGSIVATERVVADFLSLLVDEPLE